MSSADVRKRTAARGIHDWGIQGACTAVCWFTREVGGGLMWLSQLQGLQGRDWGICDARGGMATAYTHQHVPAAAL